MDRQVMVYEFMKQLIHEKGLILDQSNKSFIRFSTEELDSVLGFVGEGWTESKRVLLFEINNRKELLNLKLIIGPADSLIREKVHNITSQKRNLFNKGNKPLTNEWTTKHSVKLATKEQLDTASDEELKEYIRLRFDRFVRDEVSNLCNGLREDTIVVKAQTEWIITCNSRYYDVKGAFASLKSVTWKQSVNIKVNDIVYIYMTSPDKQIKYKCIAKQIDLPTATIDDTAFCRETTPYENYGRYMELKLIEEYEDEILSLEVIRRYGIKSVQGPCRVPEQLSTYINESISREDEIADIEDVSDIGETEKLTIIKSRIGHGALKRRLTQKEGKCALCGLSDERFLIASHIKPWSESTNTERLDLDNVLLLCPHHDAVFDKGYIAFDEDGKLIISNKLDLETRVLLNLVDGKKIKLKEGSEKYIEWHRENLFINQ